MPSPVQMKTLLEAGVHFGHQTRRWNPKMRQFIFTERNGIHIIDLQQTVRKLEDAMAYVRDLSARGGIILFIGTKKQAQETIEDEAKRCSMPYVNRRWMGGMLTNFATIRGRIQRLEEIEQRKAMGEFDRLPKKEQGRIDDELERLNRLLGGMRRQYKLPDAVFIVDPHREEIAVAESRRAEVPIVAMVDTNCNPDLIDYSIPANDDAIRAIRLLTSKIADAVIEGRQAREAVTGETGAGLAAETGEEEELDKSAAIGVHITEEDFVRPESKAAEAPAVEARRDEAPAGEAPAAQPAPTEAPAEPTAAVGQAASAPVAEPPVTEPPVAEAAVEPAVATAEPAPEATAAPEAEPALAGPLGAVAGAVGAAPSAVGDALAGAAGAVGGAVSVRRGERAESADGEGGAPQGAPAEAAGEPAKSETRPRRRATSAAQEPAEG